jgi:hypothetical protein
MGKGFSGIGTVDGKGGLILPDEAVEALKDADGTTPAIYPFVTYEGKEGKSTPLSKRSRAGQSAARSRKRSTRRTLRKRRRLARSLFRFSNHRQMWCSKPPASATWNALGRQKRGTKMTTKIISFPVAKTQAQIPVQLSNVLVEPASERRNFVEGVIVKVEHGEALVKFPNAKNVGSATSRRRW